jgi:hypothetical protein
METSVSTYSCIFGLKREEAFSTNSMLEAPTSSLRYEPDIPP